MTGGHTQEKCFQALAEGALPEGPDGRTDRQASCAARARWRRYKTKRGDASAKLARLLRPDGRASFEVFPWAATDTRPGIAAQPAVRDASTYRWRGTGLLIDVAPHAGAQQQASHSREEAGRPRATGYLPSAGGDHVRLPTPALLHVPIKEQNASWLRRHEPRPAENGRRPAQRGLEKLRLSCRGIPSRRTWNTLPARPMERPARRSPPASL